MGDQRKGGIRWTDETWNPIRGCSRVSEGCRHCYAEVMAARFSGPGMPYEGLATLEDGKARWTGKVALIPDMLARPFHWKRPRRIFVNSMSDLFHEGLPDADRDQIMAVMAMSYQHTFQVLTKRADVMRRYLSDPGLFDRIEAIIQTQYEHDDWVWQPSIAGWPLKNVWFGVSVENQSAADDRIPDLMMTPAAVRFLSCEPLLGPVALDAIECPNGCTAPGYCNRCDPDGGEANGTIDCLGDGHIGWVIVGGESGPGSRPMSVVWLRALRDQCKAAGTPFFFKQWGDWSGGGLEARTGGKPGTRAIVPHHGGMSTVVEDVGPIREFASFGSSLMVRRGKHVTGNVLDGATHEHFPS